MNEMIQSALEQAPQLVVLGFIVLKFLNTLESNQNDHRNEIVQEFIVNRKDRQDTALVIRENTKALTQVNETLREKSA